MPHRDAQHYRNRAKELKAEAAKRTDDIAKNVLLHAAEQCEQMARDFDLRGRVQLPG